MSITHVGAATGTTTATVPAHNIGDLIIIYAYRSGSTTAPTLGAGYTSIRTQAGTTSSARIGFKIATSTSDTSGTWTNATQLTCLVYRSSNYATGSSLFIGGSASTSSITTTVNYPALTMTHADNTSWAIGFAGTSVATAALSTHAPAGMTFFSGSDVTATVEVCAFDTNGTVSSWASTNTTVSAAGNSVSATVELIENLAGSAVANNIQHIATAYTNSNATGETGDLFVLNFDYLTGNSLVLGVNYQVGVTPVVTDNQGNTWPIVGSGNVITVTGGGMATSIFVLASPASGTNQITVSLGGVPQAMVSLWLDQLFNVTATVEGHVSAASVATTSGIISPGAFTPSTANCLILSYLCADASTGVTTNPALIVPETGYALNDADISWGAAGIPKASQFTLQTTAVSTTPRFYLNAGGTVDTYNVVALALSTGSQGTAKPSGAGASPWVDRICHFGTNAAPASWFLQIPSSGNAAAFMSSFQGTGTPDWTAISDNDGISWTVQNPTAGAPTPFTRVNSSARLSRTATVTIGNNASQNFFAIYYDISNCATAPIVSKVGVGSTGASNVNTIASQPTITPTGTQQLTLDYMGIGVGPSIGITTPTGATYDLPAYSVAKVTATIAATTLTVSATAWGSIGSGNIVSGSGVTVGTTVQSGTGPFTIQPSQTVSSPTTMLISNSDVSTMNWGNAAGHYFNNSNVSAQNWTWGISNQPSSSVLSTALIFAGPPASAAGPNNQYNWPIAPPNPWYRSWETWHNPTPRVLDNFRQNDWPVPQRPTWYQDWSLNPITLRTAVQRPFFNRDWPNPQPVQWYRTWEQRFTLSIPFHQSDWPLPGSYPRPDATWTWSYNLNLIGQDKLPIRQQDWPNPLTPSWYQVWALNLLQSTLTPAFQAPFFQLDWPVPVGNPRPDEFYSFNNIEVISNQPASFFRNQDWPNPYPVQWYRDWYQTLVPGVLQGPFRQNDWLNPYPIKWYQDWHQALAPYLPNIEPFSQTDWPNPKTFSPIDQWWFQNLISLLTATPPSLPFNQSDWPLPKTFPPIDQFQSQSLVLNLPEPPPTPIQIFAGRQISPEEALRAWMTALGAKGRIARYG